MFIFWYYFYQFISIDLKGGENTKNKILVISIAILILLSINIASAAEMDDSLNDIETIEDQDALTIEENQEPQSIEEIEEDSKVQTSDDASLGASSDDVGKLEITQTTYEGNSTDVDVGQMKFKVSIKNTGEVNVGDISISDIACEGLDDFDLEPIGPTTEWGEEGGKIKYNGELEPGAETSVIITYRAVKKGVYTNSIEVTSNCAGSYTVESDSFTIYEPKISLEKTAESPYVNLGDLAAFIITVTNTGDRALEPREFEIYEEPPLGLEYDHIESIEGTWDKGEEDIDPITLNSALDIGKSASFKIYFKTSEIGEFENMVKCFLSRNLFDSSAKVKVGNPSKVSGENVSVNVEDAIEIPVKSENATSIEYKIIDKDGKIVVNGTLKPGENIKLANGLKAGNYTVNLSTVVDGNHTPASNTSTIEVKKILPALSASAPSTTVKKDGKVTVNLPKDATGTVTLEIEGKTYTATVKDGKAEFTVSGLKAGTHNYKASYSGDDKYLPNTYTGSIEVSDSSDNETNAEDEEDTQDGVDEPDDKETKTGALEPKKEKSKAKTGLARYDAGNPIMALLIALALLGVNTRGRKR